MKENLRRLSLFAALDPKTIDHLTRDLPSRKFKKDELIIKQGDKELRAHLLMEGRVGVFAESARRSKATIIYHEAPYILGEIEIWQERPALGSVIAIEPCTTLQVSKKAYLKMLHSSHQLCINLVQILSNLLYDTGREKRVRMFGKVEHRLANTLCSLAELYGEERQYGILIRKEVNKSEIAEILGVNRRSVHRALETLEEENLIQIEGRQLVIPDLTALRKKASSPITGT